MNSLLNKEIRKFIIMKKIIVSLTFGLAALAAVSFVNSPPEELAINAAIPQGDYKMKDVSGKSTSLNEIKTAKRITCNL